MEDRSSAQRVFLPSGEPSTTADSHGRFVLERILPDRTYLLVQAREFRLRGWPAIPARQAEERKYTLARTSDPPDRSRRTPSAPISPEESRTLARRVLDPYLKTVLEKGDESTRMQCLRTLSAIDPTEVLELLKTGTIAERGLGR